MIGSNKGRSRAALALAAAFALAAVTGCQKKAEEPSATATAGSAETPGPAPRTEAFASWDEFVASDALKNNRPHPVVFIGIDGATWEYMGGLVERGVLPNVARLRREGAYATLRSVQSYVSPPAWTSMLTGYLPAKSGIYSFGAFDRGLNDFVSVRSADVLVPFVWEAASRVGLKTAVVNVPMTYPVYPVNGIMASGLLTPIDLGRAVALRLSARTDIDPLYQKARRDAAQELRDYSEPMGSAVEDDLNLFVMFLHDTSDDGRRNYDTVSMSGYEKEPGGKVGKETGMWTFPLGEYSSWVSVRVRDNNADRFGFARMKVDIEQGEAELKFSDTLFPVEATFTYPEELAARLQEHFTYYLPTKMLAAEIVPTITRDMREYASYFYDYDDWDDFFFVFTQSDNIHHKDGFGELSDSVYAEIDRCLGDMMARLPSDAVLVVASDHGFQSYDYAIDLNRYLSELNLLSYEARGVDYTNSVVVHNLWHLHFNRALMTRAELARRGIDVPASADPVEFMMQYLADAFRRIRSGEREFPVEIAPIPEGARGEPPDMQVTGSYGDYGVTYWNVMKPHEKVVWTPHGPDKFWHTRRGILMVWGDGVKRGFDGGTVDIQHVAPTISYLLGIPVGDDVDGRVLTEFFDTDFVAGRTLYVNHGYGEALRATAETAEGREDLEKKLRSLGYIQ
jgi:predicted AlkP superfamily phosphohydrolase/phosphomutase